MKFFDEKNQKKSGKIIKICNKLPIWVRLVVYQYLDYLELLKVATLSQKDRESIRNSQIVN